MKCKNCGSNLNLLQSACPYCGTVNPHFRSQRENIDRYGKDYARTKEEVVAKSSRFAGYSVRITIIALLAFLNILFLLLGLYSWDIQYWRQEKQVEREADRHRAALEELEANFDYIGFSVYYETHDLYLSDSLEDFTKVQQVCSDYTFLFENLVMLGQEDTYQTDEERLEYIGDRLKYLYDSMEPAEYEPESYYEGNHGRLIRQLEEDLQLLLITYAGITPGEAAEFAEMSDGRRQVAMERGLGLYED